MKCCTGRYNLSRKKILSECLPAGTHGVGVGSVQHLCLLFRHLQQRRRNACQPVGVAFFYLAPIAAHDLFLPCTRCDAENGPPVRGKRRRRLALSLAFSLCPALFLCLPLPLFGFSSLLLCFSLLRCLLRFLLLLFRFLLRFLLLLFLGLAQ